MVSPFHTYVYILCTAIRSACTSFFCTNYLQSNYVVHIFNQIFPPAEKSFYFEGLNRPNFEFF